MPNNSLELWNELEQQLMLRRLQDWDDEELARHYFFPMVTWTNVTIPPRFEHAMNTVRSEMQRRESVRAFESQKQQHQDVLELSGGQLEHARQSFKKGQRLNFFMMLGTIASALAALGSWTLQYRAQSDQDALRVRVLQLEDELRSSHSAPVLPVTPTPPPTSPPALPVEKGEDAKVPSPTEPHQPKDK